jgi:hypothetical protein
LRGNEEISEVIPEETGKTNVQVSTVIPLAEGETILWHRENTSGLLQKHVTVEEAITSKRCLKYDVERKQIIAQVPISRNLEILVMNVHRVNDSVEGGVFLTPRLFGLRIPGIGVHAGPRRGNIKVFGDASVLCEGKTLMTFQNIEWPQGVRQLVKHLNGQQGFGRERALGRQPETGRSTALPYGQYGRTGPGQYRGPGERLRNVISKFRQKGATGLEKAMTAEELDLPPEFKEAMRRRLGQTGIIVEANGKYYLDEKRLEETRTKMASRRRYR